MSKVTIDIYTVVQIVLTALIAFIIASALKLPLYHGIAVIVAVCSLLLIDGYCRAKSTENLINNFITAMQGLQAPPPPQRQARTKGPILRSTIVAVDDTTNAGTFLHPRRNDIIEDNKEEGSTGTIKRYPLLNQQLYMSFEELIGSNMTLGRFVADSDGTIFPYFAETGLELSSYMKLFGDGIYGGSVQNYYYNLETNEEFISLTFDEREDHRKQNLLIRLPKNPKAKPFRSEMKN
jgi:hypothetical protein